ncbi:MAG: potassium-transporting ATPase subunit KdpA [Firmicutes bacterium]|nr:potassium-transporting ATPase subunit KdpA [Bacillota bacterium]
MMFAAVIHGASVIAAALAIAWPLGRYIARVFRGDRTTLHGVLHPIERACYRMCRIDPAAEMTWSAYATATVLFGAVSVTGLYLLQRVQGNLPLNPLHLSAVRPDLAFNTAVSFVTNTNWQAYVGEQTMSTLTQMTGLAVQNFASAATGLAVAVALIRGLTRREAATLGNFWVDLTRSVLYVLLPLALLFALILVSQGVVQTFGGPVEAHLLNPPQGAGHAPTDIQVIPRGPVASQESIKLLGTNGGGYFGANSAHPFENPTPFSNWLEMVAMLVIPFALPFTLGEFAGHRRHAWTLWVVMATLLFVGMGVAVWSEAQGNPLVAEAGGMDKVPSPNLEGKEVRFGPLDSALFAAVTTGTSTGAVDSSHDSYTPLGGLVPLWLMLLGEVAPGGVGSGLYGMLVMVVIAVFVAGLMVGRTPEYLGKKIEPFEMKMAALYFLIMPALILVATALALVTPEGARGITNPGPHGLSQVLYAFTSAANNNGSAFAGLLADSTFYNTATGLIMFMGRFWMMIPVLAMAGSLARKKVRPVTAGTLPLHGFLFAGWLLAVILIAGALNFLPVLALGPVVEHLLMAQGRSF